MTLGRPKSGCSVIGSERKTSSAAPPTLPESSAASRSSSTISGPRATLSTRTPSLHLASASASSQPSVSGVLGRCSGEEVGLRVDVVGGLGLLDAELAVALGADERVEGDDAHPEALGAMGHELADAPEAEDPERLVEQLDARELRALPLAGDQARVRLGHVAGQREQQRHRVLGGGDDVGLRRVGDDDAALGGGGDVDVVDAHAGAADGLQARRAVDHVGRRASSPSG